MTAAVRRIAKRLTACFYQAGDIDQLAVRIVWERDGETWLDGTATRWAGQCVFVRFDDERSRLGFAWVDGGDVTAPLVQD